MGEPAERRHANRLAGETSPYLLQHADNPVDWYPWGPDAMERARAEDKPILLSVGYAACHWCHVMAHESFEDPETAALMNEHFVSVKVDREERPDVDAIYMSAVQAMTGQGGWPMTVVLTPEGEPFFAGTYFPSTDRLGMPSFRKVLVAVAQAWRDRRDDARQQGRQVAQHVAMQTGALAGAAGELDEEVLRRALEGIGQGFDPTWGGFASAPKFPQPMTLEFLLRCSLRGYPGALDMARLTLDKMAAGGIFDQVGGGFHRYSTDHRWLVPHFEKMLYDNAQLVRLYARAWQVTGAERYREVARRTAGYLLRDLRHPDGGFFSSQDADSEGVEGKFFVWSFQELSEVAGELVARWFGATPEGNWEGVNVLWTPLPPEVAAERAGVPVDELERAVGSGPPGHRRQGPGRLERLGDRRARGGGPGAARARLRRGGESLRRIRARHHAGAWRPAVEGVAGGPPRRPGLPRRLRLHGGGLPDAVRDHLRAALAPRRGRPRRRDPGAVHGPARRLLPDGQRRGAAGGPAQGAVRQRRAGGLVGGG
jgi:uncharacterized protein YyaL (SSP411 family)